MHSHPHLSPTWPCPKGWLQLTSAWVVCHAMFVLMHARHAGVPCALSHIAVYILQRGNRLCASGLMQSDRERQCSSGIHMR